MFEVKLANLEAFQAPIAEALTGIEALKEKIPSEFFNFQAEDMNRKEPSVEQSGETRWYTLIRMWSRLRALRKFRRELKQAYKARKVKIKFERIKWSKGVIVGQGPLLFPEMRERLNDRMRAVLHQGVLKGD